MSSVKVISVSSCIQGTLSSRARLAELLDRARAREKVFCIRRGGYLIVVNFKIIKISNNKFNSWRKKCR